MPKPDARGLVRLSRNPPCEVLAAMLLLGLPDETFFQEYTGRPFPGERGRRSSALRIGAIFDAKLAADRAAALITALAPIPWFTGESVRDLRDEVPGRSAADQAKRVHITRQLIHEAAMGGHPPDLILQGVLVLPIGGLRQTIVPDALVLDRANGVYVPLEAKAYIAVEGVAEPGDLDEARRQAAVYIVALRASLTEIGQSDRVRNRGILVLASQFGFRPHDAVEELLDAEVAAVDRAHRTLVATGARLHALRESMTQQEAIRELDIRFQESCLVYCPLGEECRAHAPGLVGAIGDAAGWVLPPGLDLGQAQALLNGANPRDDGERVFVATMTATASQFGWSGGNGIFIP